MLLTSLVARHVVRARKARARAAVVRVPPMTPLPSKGRSGNESTRTVLVALGTGLGVALAKAGAAVFTGSPALAAEASHSLADTANDLFLLIAQGRSTRPTSSQHPLRHGREAYFWALIAACGAFVAGAAFSFRDGIDALIHPSATSSFAVAYTVLAISTVLDLVSIRQSAGQLIARGRLYSVEASSRSPRSRLIPLSELCSSKTRCQCRETCSRLSPWASTRSRGHRCLKESPRCS